MARDLYNSLWFRKASAVADMFGDDWFVLSALHGLVHSMSVIRPYDSSLNDMDASRRKKWSEKVVGQIQESIEPCTLVIMAGKKYRQGITESLTDYTVIVPMMGLGIGEQLRWMNQKLSQRKPIIL